MTENFCVKAVNKIQSELELLNLVHEFNMIIPRTTQSIGISYLFLNHDTKLTKLLEYLDKTLYQSKQNV
jgi:PleD family two-component response regulator